MKKISKSKISNYDINIINFIFRSKYDMKEESVDNLNIPPRIQELVYKQLHSYEWEISLLDWLEISDSNIRRIRGIGEKSIKEYRKIINNYLIDNKIDPNKFYHYAYTFQLVNFCLEYNIDLIQYIDAYRIIRFYKYGGEEITEEQDNKLRKYVSDVLIKYYTEGIYSGIAFNTISDISFYRYTGHSFNEFMRDCFEEEIA